MFHGPETILTIGAILASIVLYFVIDILKEIKGVRQLPALIEQMARLLDKVDFLLQKNAAYEVRLEGYKEQMESLISRIEKLEDRYSGKTFN